MAGSGRELQCEAGQRNDAIELKRSSGAFSRSCARMRANSSAGESSSQRLGRIRGGSAYGRTCAVAQVPAALGLTVWTAALRC